MMDREYRARIAALSVLHACACVRLLRAHGRPAHANDLEAALDEVTRVLAQQLGHDALVAAMDWATDQIWSVSEAEATIETKVTLH
jgi:hypothetical protein